MTATAQYSSTHPWHDIQAVMAQYSGTHSWHSIQVNSHGTVFKYTVTVTVFRDTQQSHGTQRQWHDIQADHLGKVLKHSHGTGFKHTAMARDSSTG
jgi:hypothetical protein